MFCRFCTHLLFFVEVSGCDHALGFCFMSKRPSICMWNKHFNPLHLSSGSLISRASVTEPKRIEEKVSFPSNIFEHLVPYLWCGPHSPKPPMKEISWVSSVLTLYLLLAPELVTSLAASLKHTVFWDESGDLNLHGWHFMGSPEVSFRVGSPEQAAHGSSLLGRCGLANTRSQRESIKEFSCL